MNKGLFYKTCVAGALLQNAKKLKCWILFTKPVHLESNG